MKIALVHDYLKEYGGAERVLEALHEIYPEAPVYTSFVDFNNLGPHAARIKKWTIRKSWMHYVWPIKKLHSPLRFLAPWVWKFFDFSQYDVVISSSGWFMCRGVKVPETAVHICYLHHPPRNLYGYATAVDWKRFLIVRIYAFVVNHFLRIYDYNTAQKVDYFVVNSQETKKRCWKFYRREATVIYPPVKIQSAKTKSQNDKQKGQYYLCVSRLARVKHVDLTIKTCLRLGKKLKVVGKGRDEEFLKTVAGESPLIEFLGEVPDEQLPQLYRGARALIFASEDEEFGIVSIEAQSYGVPVIGLNSGGIPETLIDGRTSKGAATGVLFDELSVESLGAALRYFESISIDPSACRKNAARFSEKRFNKEIESFVTTHLTKSNE